ncbi:hypothetical protein GLYMA_03G039509v4 [Glycine max]|nr:hypothetical protein GLYMA_03G039509v4 [Glycine max]
MDLFLFIWCLIFLFRPNVRLDFTFIFQQFLIFGL